MQDYRAIAAEMLHNCLSVEFPESDVKALAAFVPIANDDILQKALKELSGAVRKKVPSDFMQRLHRVYNRKIAELSRFYPAFNILETSYRSFVAYTMADIYGTHDWWRDFYAHAASLDTTSRLPRPTQINGVNISYKAAEAVFDFANSLKNDREAGKIIGTASTLTLTQYCYLRHLEQLILNDWSAFKDRFTKTITSTNFEEMFNSARDARNSLFHHREISNRPRLMSHLVELLDAIGVHLPSSYEDILHHAGHALKFEQSRETYHMGLDPLRETYTVSYQIGGAAGTPIQFTGTCESEVIMSFLYSQKATKIANLDLLKVELVSVDLADGTETPAMRLS